MARVWQLLVRADGDTAAAQKEIRALQRTTRQFGRNVSGVGRTLTAAVTAPLIGLGALGGRELVEIEAANMRTSKAIQRVGERAKLSVEGVQALAGALQRKSGIDDQAIQDASTLLITMGNLDVTTRKNVNAYKVATRSMVEFADQTGRTVDVAGKQYAMALSAAAAGTLKLPRGMKLAKGEMQKLQAAFDRTTSASGRQLLVIAALEKRYRGGMGLTNAEKWTLAMDQLAGVSADLLLTLMPAFDAIVKGLTRMTAAFESLSPSTQRLVGIFAALGFVLGPVLMFIGSMITASAALIPLIAGISLPVLGVVAALAALAVAFVVAYRRSGEFRAFVHRSMRATAAAASQILGSMRATLSQWIAWARSAWAKWGDDIMAVVRPALQFVAVWARTYLGSARDGILGVLALMRGDWSTAWEHMKSIMKRTLEYVVAMIRGAGKTWVAALKAQGQMILALDGWFREKAAALGRAIVEGVKDGVRGSASGITSFILDTLGGPVGRGVDAAINAAQRSGKGRKKRGPLLSGINALGEITSKNITPADIARYLQLSGGSAFTVSSDETGRQTATANAGVQAFLKQRMKLSKQRMNQLIAQRKKAIAALGKARLQLRNHNKALGVAKRSGSKDAVAKLQKKIDATRQTVGQLEGTIEYLESEILSLGGQIQSDADALREPDIDNSGIDATEAEAAARAKEQAARDARDAENFRRKALGLASLDEEEELAAINAIRVANGLPPIGSLSELSGGGSTGAASTTPAAAAAGGGSSSPSQSIPTLTSNSALEAVASAAARALTGNTVFNINSSDPEAVAQRVAFILGGSRMRVAGAV